MPETSRRPCLVSRRLAVPARRLVLRAVTLLAAYATAGLGAVVTVGPYAQQVATTVDLPEGWSWRDVQAMEIDPAGRLLLGGSGGLMALDGGQWQRLPELRLESIAAIETVGNEVWLAAADRFLRLRADGGLDPGPAMPEPDFTVVDFVVLEGGDTLLVGSSKGFWRWSAGSWQEEREVSRGAPRSPRDVALSGDGCTVAAASVEGLELLDACGDGNAVWRDAEPRDERRSWAQIDITGADFDGQGRLWFASPQGVGRRNPDDSWRLWGPEDGVPYLGGLSGLAVGAGGDLWLGTDRGAVRLQGGDWEYRQGRRWLPDDRVRIVRVGRDGAAWFLTGRGLGRIGHQELTLAEKARRFESAIDAMHRRSPYGYVDSVRLQKTGDLSSYAQHSSDNDGLWTAMYGAGECFAFAATGHDGFRARARQAFEALRFLGAVTQGGEFSPPPGFVARSILSTDGPDPNEGLKARDEQRRAEEDARWKVIVPRWPRSADGQWYWKSDTSSDELDGHYFFYARYFDLVAETAEEKQEVAAVVAAITDHLIRHDLSLVDHDGEPTRWAVFGPEALNHDPDWWEERGLNSLSILSYLRVAEHVTGDGKYGEIAGKLIEHDAYAMNVRHPKVHHGAGTGNQSDDEMAFMAFYNLLAYEPDADLKAIWGHAFYRYWQLIARERNPLFHLLFAAAIGDLVYTDAFGKVELQPSGQWLEDAVDSLKRYPLDRIDWGLENSHRLDISFLEGEVERGYRLDGKVLPIDERYVDHWNHDPWRLDYRGSGANLADGASFLLPFYLGLYHEILAEEGVGETIFAAGEREGE